MSCAILTINIVKWVFIITPITSYLLCFVFFSLFPAHGESYQHPKLSESAINPRHPISVLSCLKRHAGRWWDHKVSLCPPHFSVFMIMISFCHNFTFDGFWFRGRLCSSYRSLRFLDLAKWNGHLFQMKADTDHDLLLKLVCSHILWPRSFALLLLSSHIRGLFLVFWHVFSLYHPPEFWKIMVYKFHYM